MTPGVPGAPEPGMYPSSRYFLVLYITLFLDLFMPVHCDNINFDQIHSYDKMVWTVFGLDGCNLFYLLCFNFSSDAK